MELQCLFRDFKNIDIMQRKYNQPTEMSKTIDSLY